MRLVEPMKSGFQTIAPRGGNKPASKKGYGTGKETLRFKANGNATIEDEVRPRDKRSADLISTLIQPFLAQARWYYARWNRRDQRATWLVLRDQRQRAGCSDLGPRRQQNQFHGLCWSNWQFRLGGVWIHRWLHHRLVGSHYWCATGQSKAIE